MSMDWLDWQGCYDAGWKGLIVPEAFAHPAKFSYCLINRIYQHGHERGYWKRGDVIADPFGGVGLGGIIAAYQGLNWLGVELESRFIALAEKNFALHHGRWDAYGDPAPRIVQGDSRMFAELVKAAGCVTSPPYAETLLTASGHTTCQFPNGGSAAGSPEQVYGSAPGQIGALKSGDVAAVVTSPPYANMDPNTKEEERPSGTWIPRNKGDRPGKLPAQDYGHSDGQIAALPSGSVEAVVTSPPYTSSLDHAPGNKAFDGQGTQRHCGQIHVENGCGEADGNIARLPVGVVTSPPFEQALSGGGVSKAKVGQSEYQMVRANGKPLGLGAHYQPDEQGQSAGQIANETGETYWQAMSLVYAQVHQAIRPGGICAIVVKDYVKDKARVPLCDQTAQLLEHLGFTVFQRCRAWLVKERKHAGLFGQITEKKERKSFFRRLAEKKGSPHIDWEEVLWART